jgi:hypothetical protein
LRIFAVLAVLLPATAAAQVDVFVNGSPDPGNSYPTFTAALGALGGSVSGPTILRATTSGPFAEQLDVTGIAGTSAVNTLTLEGPPGGAPAVVTTAAIGGTVYNAFPAPRVYNKTSDVIVMFVSDPAGKSGGQISRSYGSGRTMRRNPRRPRATQRAPAPLPAAAGAAAAGAETTPSPAAVRPPGGCCWWRWDWRSRRGRVSAVPAESGVPVAGVTLRGAAPPFA